MLKNALSYIEKGWAVFPVVLGGKFPATSNGFKDASIDAKTIKRWFEAGDKNIGIATGAISGLIVVDIDKKSGGYESLEVLRPKLPETLTAKTGGGGLHFYYRAPIGQPVRNRAGLYPGIDIRGDGGYVVAPPSLTENNYEWVNADTPIVELPEWLLTQLVDTTPKPSPLSSSKTIPIKGELAKATLDFLLNGAPPGTWNHRLFKAAKDYQEQGLSKDDFIERAMNITGHLDETDMSTIESAFRGAPKYGPRITSNSGLKDLILSCYLITDISDSNHRVFVNFETGKIHDIDPEHLNKLSKDERDTYKSRMLDATFEYNPRASSPLTMNEDIGIYTYNWYNPPEWKRESFFFNRPISPVPKIPEIYDKFLTHLTSGHEESKEYILDWIANSLQSRNFTILTAIGEEGIGKGILASVLESLHGKYNFAQCSDTVFKEKFNGKLQNKTLVYIDEVALENNASHDRIKAVVNEELEIEKKGEDAITSRNYASFYITSNRMDAVRIGPEDRRYSIIQLTETKLKDTELRNLITSEILNAGNLDALARYLYFRKVTYDMLKPFRSQRFEEMLAAGLSQWEEWFLEEFLPTYKSGELIDMGFVQKEIKDKAGLLAAPSRRKIEALRRRYPTRFSIPRDEKALGKRKIRVL